MTINYTYTINSTNFPSSQNFYWEVISNSGGANPGTVSSDFDVSSGGPVACTGNTTTFEVGVKEQTGTQGTRDFTLRVGTNASFTGTVVTLNFQVTDGAALSPTVTVSGSTSLTEPSAGVSRTANFGDIDGADHGSLNVNSLDFYTITIFPTDGNIAILSDTNCTAGSHNNATGEYTVGGFKNAGAWNVTVQDTITTVAETHSGTVTVVGENTYTVTTTNVVDGTYYYWELSDDTGTTFDAAVDTISGYIDNGTTTVLVGTVLRGRVLINSNAGSFKVRLNHNAAQTGSPTCKLRLYQDSGYSTEVSNPTYPGTITIGSVATSSLDLSGPTTIAEPDPGVVRPYNFNAHDGTNNSLVINGAMHYLDIAEVAIDKNLSGTITISGAGNPGFTIDQQWADPQTNWQSDLSTSLPGYIVSFKNANGGGSVTVTDSQNGAESHTYSLDTTGEYTYTFVSTYLSQTLYWQAEAATGGSTSNWVTGYTTGAGTTSASGNNLRGTVTTDGSGNGSFKIRLNASQSIHTFNIKIYTDSGYSTEVSNPTYPGTISVTLPVASYTAEMVNPPVTISEDENDVAEFHVRTTGVATDGSVSVPVSVSGTGVTTGDLLVATAASYPTYYTVTQLSPLQATTIGNVEAVVGATGIGVIFFRAVADLSTGGEGTETVTVTMASTASNGDSTGGGSANFDISDTSTGVIGTINIDDIPNTSPNQFSAKSFEFRNTTGSPAANADAQACLSVVVEDTGTDTIVKFAYRHIGTSGTDPGPNSVSVYYPEGSNSQNNLTVLSSSNNGVAAWTLAGVTGTSNTARYNLSSKSANWDTNINTRSATTLNSLLGTSWSALPSGSSGSIMGSGVDRGIEFYRQATTTTAQTVGSTEQANLAITINSGSVDYTVTWEIQVGAQAERIDI